jgi:hypothetical protein
MTSESDIEDYLIDAVKSVKGETRKVKWIGRKDAPDRRVMIPGFCCWAEVKAPGQKPRASQLREHERMRKCGEIVLVIDSYVAVDSLIRKADAHVQKRIWRSIVAKLE